MLILLSPAKKLNLDTNHIPSNHYPQFLDKANELIQILKQYDTNKLSQLMKISPQLAELNWQRFQTWNIDHTKAKPSLFIFNGDVYEGLNAAAFKDKDIEFCQANLKILSGLYGILNPLDKIYPYRLEMGTKIIGGKFNNLYQYWQDTQTNYINQYFKQNTQDNILINLASDEYFKVINHTNLKAKVIKIIFEQQKNGIYKNISFLTKYARGLMARYIIQNQIKDLEKLKKFNTNGYKFVHQLSDNNTFTFRLN